VYVSSLQLTNFRNYATAHVALAPGANIFAGANGQGKTNLVEALAYLATLSSHRVATDAPLVRVRQDQAIVRAEVVRSLSDERTLLVEVEINSHAANRARLNKVPQRRVRDIIGALQVVMFTPDDLDLVKGDPSARRDYIDMVVIDRWPRMAGVKADFERVLKQRNALLKQLALSASARPLSRDDAYTLDVWDEQLATYGTELTTARIDTLDALSPHIAHAYADIAPANSATGASYAKSWRDDSLLAALQAQRPQELRRGLTLVGPHRDEIEFTIGDFPAKGYASHGESWSLALALKLAVFQLLRAEAVDPVLILDDVFAELDESRRARLAAAIADAEQVLITAAVDDDIPAQLSGRRFQVKSGVVTPEEVETLGEVVTPEEVVTPGVSA
jgi:DNA replication and repair protein RecF